MPDQHVWVVECHRDEQSSILAIFYNLEDATERVTYEEQLLINLHNTITLDAYEIR